MSTQLVKVACYNCGSDSPEFYLAENGYNIDKCRSCGLLYMSERPNDAVIENATAIGQHHGESDLDANAYYNKAVIPHYRSVLEDIYGNDIGRFQSWLDIGCGHGEFIEAVRDHTDGRISVRGSEPNENKQASAAKRGLDIRFIDLDTHDAQYDIASLLNVYSHLPDPKEFIRNLKKVIRPGGEFLLQTGDVADFSPERILKPLCLPDHMSFASETILRNMLTDLGFEILSVHKYPNLEISIRGIGKEVVKLFLPKYNSYLKYYLDWKAHSTSRMYIRAVLRA